MTEKGSRIYHLHTYKKKISQGEGSHENKTSNADCMKNQAMEVRIKWMIVSDGCVVACGINKYNRDGAVRFVDYWALHYIL